MPRLAGVDEIPSRFDSIRHAAQGPAYRRIFRKQLIESGHHSQRWAWADGRHGGTVEGIALLELGNRLQSLLTDQLCALTDINVAEIAEQNVVCPIWVGLDGLEYVPSMACGNVSNAYRAAGGPQC